MNHEQAKKILDQVKAGQGDSFGENVICLALRYTGDLEFPETVGGQGMDQEISQEDWRGRVRQRAIMVGGSKG